MTARGISGDCHCGGWSVNYHCLDDGFDVKPKIRKFDGRNWKKAKAGM